MSTRRWTRSTFSPTRFSLQSGKASPDTPLASQPPHPQLRPMNIPQIVRAVSAALLVVACAPAPTVQTPSPAVGSTAVPASSAPLGAPGYRPEFGTMWTFDAPPLEYWKNTYGFTPDQAWLDNVRKASVRLPNCSASFVSANGLVMTN